MNAKPDYVIVIPARYESQRLPGKVLLDICGKPLLQHAWERAMSASASKVVIATDHDAIMDAAHTFGADVVMTASDHSSGSDRIAECARIMNWPDEQVIVNLQGDEPLMPAECLEQVAGLLTGDSRADAATLYWPVADAAEAANPNAVKVVLDGQGAALLFSRATIPYPRDYESIQAAFDAGVRWKRHLGLYAYRKASLERFARSAPTPLEQLERLEQLRFLEHGGRILVERARQAIPPGVDTQMDLERVRNVLSNQLR